MLELIADEPTITVKDAKRVILAASRAAGDDVRAFSPRLDPLARHVEALAIEAGTRLALNLQDDMQ